MKLYHITALVASFTGSAMAAMPTVLPEFKDEKQLATWRAEQQSAQASTAATAEAMAFYTGKPYLASAGGYAFKYRNYQPELARWTSEDPSGFPDGANCNFYAPKPTSELDFQGLSRTVVFKEYHLAEIKNEYTSDQIFQDLSMNPVNGLVVVNNAFQVFQNSILQAYIVGSPQLVGPLASVLTGIIGDEYTLRSGYPKDAITAVSFKKTSDMGNTGGYIFHAFVSSEKEYSYSE
jgi:RHS repeat-associated protein